MKLSVIVPSYREPKLLNNIKMIEEVVSATFPDYEIICVEDGTNASKKINRKLVKSDKVKIISYPLNVGKGFAFLYGFTQSTGDLIALLDADLDIHPKHIRLYADIMKLNNADIVIGSKRHYLSKVKYPFIRKVYSRILQTIVHLLFGLNIADTQVGVKLFKRSVLQKVLPRLVVKTFAFDLEVLVVANHLGFKKIVEAPVELKLTLGSKININAVRRFFQDTAAIYYRLNILKYYDRKLPKKSFDI